MSVIAYARPRSTTFSCYLWIMNSMFLSQSRVVLLRALKKYLPYSEHRFLIYCSSSSSLAQASLSKCSSYIIYHHHSKNLTE